LELTNEVSNGVPSQVTREVGTNPVPFTVSVIPIDPGCTFVGETISMKGTGVFAALRVVQLDEPKEAIAIANRRKCHQQIALIFGRAKKLSDTMNGRSSWVSSDACELP
jgi:hypothetical protein